jgi:arylsulfatase A-like enzyme/tetratricopeptide (TPR) repeat protein
VTSLARKHFSPASQITGEVLPELKTIDCLAGAHGALRGWNVLLVTLDTTRADHLGCYGNRGIRTPTLDGLAREGVLCANAVTPVPATLPAHASLLTGLYPYHHGARANGTFTLEDRNLTLAEVLHAQGYATAAAISAYVLDSSYGLDQGFDLYHDDLTRGLKHAPNMYRERPAELTNEALFPWLREHAGERFFCWVHYFDPHATYTPPEPYRTDYAAVPYDGEIAYVDSQLGKLLSLLSELGVREKTLVIVTADHGESLGEHGERTHSLLIYDATVRVPLVLSAPAALARGEVLRRQVSLVDVAPTILDLLGIDPPVHFDGLSLRSAPPSSPRACYIETLMPKTMHGWAPLLGVRRDDYKFILAPRAEVYDLRKDPGELHNLFDDRPDVAVDLHQILKQFVGEDPLLAADVPQNLEMDQDAVAKLTALGYVTTTPPQGTGSAAAIDPKDGIIHWERVEKGTDDCNSGKLKEGIATLENCLQEVPDDVWTLQILAGAFQNAGRLEDALGLLERVRKLSSKDPSVLLGISELHIQLGRLDDAEAEIKEVLAAQPDHSGAYLQLARISLGRRNDAQALELLRKALELDRGVRKASIFNALADFHLVRGQLAEAKDFFQKAIEVDAFNGDAHGGLAEALLSESDRDQAQAQLEQAIRFSPAQPRPLAVLGAVFSDKGEFEAAIKCCERAIEIRPSFGPAYVNLGLAYRRKGDVDKAEETYRKGLETSPGYDALHQNLAQVLYRKGNNEEAFEEFKKAAQLNRYNSVALANVGVFHMRAGRHQLARRCFQLALQARPDDAFAHKGLGMLCMSEDRPREGIAHLERSLELDPNQPDAGKLRYQLEQYRLFPASQPEGPQAPELPEPSVEELLGGASTKEAPP